jgi:hypothetical protein
MSRRHQELAAKKEAENAKKRKNKVEAKNAGQVSPQFRSLSD